jgi:hypothetical protein
VTKATTTTRTAERPSVKGTALCLLWPFIFASACASATSPARHAQAPLARPLHRGPLTDFVPAAGLRWIVLAEPKQLFLERELADAITEIVPNVRLDAFAESTGVDLRRVTRGVVAGFSYSTLYLAELPDGVAKAVRERFSERLLAGAVTKEPRPNLLRVTGVVGQTPETLLTVEERWLAVAVGDPSVARIAEAYAEGRLKNSPSALHGSALSTLPEPAANNVAVLLAPGPFADEWQRAAGGLLESALAFGIALRPLADGKVAATLWLSGAWQTSAEAAKDQLRSAWVTLCRSSAGRLFSLPETAILTASPELLTLETTLDLKPLVRGLKAAVLGDISELLRLPESPAKRPTLPAPRTPE